MVDKKSNAGDTDVLSDDERVKSERLRDEMAPTQDAQPIPQQNAGGDKADTAGQHGKMAPETAKGLDSQQGS